MVHFGGRVLDPPPPRHFAGPHFAPRHCAGDRPGTSPAHKPRSRSGIDTPPNIAIVGATGAVGQELISLILERDFPHGSLALLASKRSAGSTLEQDGRRFPVHELTEDRLEGIDLAFFSAGGSISRAFAPAAVARGAIVIDNSSAFRMDPAVPLIVPEINWSALSGSGIRLGTSPGIIANPNCSTIIGLMAVTPLHRAVGVARMVVSTYQAASGAGAALMAELEQQARDYASGRPYTMAVSGRQYLFNVFSHDSKIGADGYNEEEVKLARETAKIWQDDDVRITATCVRVPVLRAHSESINLTFRTPLSRDTACSLLESAPGVLIVDDPEKNRHPEPIDAAGRDAVLVGRIRGDRSQPPGMGLDLFVAGDQLRKGAALNAIQIGERLVECA